MTFQPQLFHRRSNRSLSSIGRCRSRWCLGMYGFVFPSFSSMTTARGKSGRCFVGPGFAPSLTPSVRLFSYLERSLHVAQYCMSMRKTSTVFLCPSNGHLRISILLVARWNYVLSFAHFALYLSLSNDHIASGSAYILLLVSSPFSRCSTERTRSRINF